MHICHHHVAMRDRIFYTQFWGKKVMRQSFEKSRNSYPGHEIWCNMTRKLKEHDPKAILRPYHFRILEESSTFLLRISLLKIQHFWGPKSLIKSLVKKFNFFQNLKMIGSQNTFWVMFFQFPNHITSYFMTWVWILTFFKYPSFSLFCLKIGCRIFYRA